MLEIFSVTASIFVLIGLGHISARSSLFSASDFSAFAKFLLNFALPALILRAMWQRHLDEVFSIGFLLSYLLGSLLLFGVGYWWSRRIAKLSPTESTFQGMAVSCANSGYVGYPVLLMVLPEIASTALTLAMIVENLILIPLVLVMAERAKGGGERGWPLAIHVAGRLLRNPIIGAVAVGLGVSLLQLEVPVAIAKSVDLLALSSTAIALVVIGGTLPRLPLHVIDSKILPVVLGKLILHPLAVGLCLMATASAGLAVADPQLAAAAIIIAAMPTMGIYPILAQRYEGQGRAPVTMLVITVVSFFSISLILHILNMSSAS